MRLTNSMRLLTCAAIAGSVAFAVAIPAGSASARVPKPPKQISCSSDTGTSASGSDVVTLGGCAGNKNVLSGGTGTQSASTLDIVWTSTTKKPKQTNINYSSTYTTLNPHGCATTYMGTGYTATATETGSVTSGKIGAGYAFSSLECVYYGTHVYSYTLSFTLTK
jgi:hypothetical protein